MAAKGSRKYELYLDSDVADILLETSAIRDIQLDNALNQIVREWGQSKQIEPLDNTPKPPDLSDLQKPSRFMKMSLEALKVYKKKYLKPSPEYLEDRVLFLESWFETLYNEIMELPIWNDESE
jgi:hypothetical protein